MTLYEACSVIEGFSGHEPTREETVEAWQFIYDTRAYEHLQGFYGRTIAHLINENIIRKNNNER